MCTNITFMDFLKESLDSSFKITKTEVGKFGVTLYYLDMPDSAKKYRIFVETVKENKDISLHIGFERKINNKWEILPLTDDLDTREVLGLFGSIKKIITSLEFNSLYIETDNPKKLQLYHNMAVKLNRELKFNHIARDNHSIQIYDGAYVPDIKIKYKK